MKNIVLKLDDVCKHYENKIVLKKLNFELSKGEIVGLIGHNGAGKSTTMSIITRIILKYDGNVEILGQNIKNIKYGKKTVGAMIENPEFYPNLSGIDNLKYCMSLNKEKINMEEVMEYAKKLEIDEDLKRKVKTYSVGMKKKLDFIQAICGNPEVVLLDEPMSGVDPYIIPRMRDIIKKKAEEGCSFLIATHQLSEATKLCDRVLMIHKGSIKKDFVLEESMNDEYLEDLFIKVVEEDA